MSELSADPPNSRLFILCGKTVTDEELHEAFDKYGHIKDIWIVKDRNTMESKGVVYIKFSKSSEAALAQEEMNGKTLAAGGKPIKVMIAHSREQGSRFDDDPERLLRLFILVPKAASEEQLEEYFKKFGDLDYVSIVKNKTSGESKGVAYVKYHRAYHAAKAYEECSRSYKAVFARPREQKNQSSIDSNDRMGFSAPYNGPPGGGSGGRWGAGSGMLSSGSGSPASGGRLIALLHSSLRDEQIYRLFDICPGLVDIRPQANRIYGMQKVLVDYNCHAAAVHACEKLNGFEYPPNYRISVKPYGSSMDEMSDGGGASGGLLGHAPVKPEVNGSSGMTTISNTELATLTAALAKAETIIKTAGLGTQAPTSGLLKASEADTFDQTYCSVRLPPPQPLAAPTDEETFRLFIVCQPGLPSMYALRDIFGRFGNLIEVYTLHGKNCGYVTYATKESSDNAIKTLHLQEVCGMRMKVMVAEPPRPGVTRSDRKRMRTDEEDRASSS
ncbi:RNA recognition motif. (a.k.a. RRM, RBD, or RNP domain) [Nesidiocoris tenuis]|uniref:RNA recognition motif. (A.k.a. RRM, RBD, or RNP domain) n=1 Tax=Nesidiocoris tenuis TaxID=355587 RepID=A0ABN7BCY5_9HEMI|nr:RNA recognition motif. (a.k.a. RRM, RBD, or RNP domain) [Nesidiocoris tenuis]